MDIKITETEVIVDGKRYVYEPNPDKPRSQGIGKGSSAPIRNTSGFSFPPECLHAFHEYVTFRESVSKGGMK